MYEINWLKWSKYRLFYCRKDAQDSDDDDSRIRDGQIFFIKNPLYNAFQTSAA